jgi:hypothetical protein
MSLAASAPAILLNHLFCPKRIGLRTLRCVSIFVIADPTNGGIPPSSVGNNANAFASGFGSPFTTLTASPVVLRHVPWQHKQSVAHDFVNVSRYAL